MKPGSKVPSRLLTDRQSGLPLLREKISANMSCLEGLNPLSCWGSPVVQLLAVVSSGVDADIPHAYCIDPYVTCQSAHTKVSSSLCVAGELCQYTTDCPDGVIAEVRDRILFACKERACTRF